MDLDSEPIDRDSSSYDKCGFWYWKFMLASNLPTFLIESKPDIAYSVICARHLQQNIIYIRVM